MFDYNDEEEEENRQGDMQYMQGETSDQDFNTVKQETVAQIVGGDTNSNSNEENMEQQQQKKKGKLPEEEILRLINEKYQHEDALKDVSVIYDGDRIYD